MFHLAMWNCSAHVSFRNVLESLRPCFISQWAGIAPPVFHFAMGWSRSAHVSFRNGLESLRPCFVLQWAGIAPPVFRFAMGWNCSAHVSFRNGLELLRPCFVSQLAGITLPTFYSSVVLTVGIPADLIFQLGWDTSRCHSLCLLMRGWDTS